MSRYLPSARDPRHTHTHTPPPFPSLLLPYLWARQFISYSPTRQASYIIVSSAVMGRQQEARSRSTLQQVVSLIYIIYLLLSMPRLSVCRTSTICQGLWRTRVGENRTGNIVNITVCNVFTDLCTTRCCLVVTRRSLFIYFLPADPSWRAMKVMMKSSSVYGWCNGIRGTQPPAEKIWLMEKS